MVLRAWRAECGWARQRRDAASNATNALFLMATTPINALLSIAVRVDAPGPSRWTLFSHARTDGAGLATFSFLPPSAGPALLPGPVLEDVRFARDEMPNMAWGIERTVQSRSGEPRPGFERNAAVDGAAPAAPPSANNGLVYHVDSKVPVHWIPFVAVPVPNRAPAIELERAAVLRPAPGSADGATSPIIARPAGVILLPPGVTAYRIPEEEIPRSGLRVERVVYSARRIDGSGHLWVGRRRRAGAGESQSGLRFDIAKLDTSE